MRSSGGGIVKRLPDIFIGALLAVALFAIGLAVGSNYQHTDVAQEVSEKFDTEQWLTKDAGGFFTFLLVVVGGLQLLLFAWQLWLIRESLKDAKLAADAARDAAKAATLQAETAAKEFISSHRPKLIVRELLRLTSVSPGRSIELRYVIANVGSSDAEVVESHVEIQDIRDGILRPLQPFEGANPIGRAVLAPGSHIFREQGSTVSTLSLAVSRMVEERQRARGRQTEDGRGVYFRGFVIYADKNGVRRRTGFCRIYDAETERFYATDDPDYEYAD